MVKFNRISEKKIARELGELLFKFDDSSKFRRQLNAMQMRKIKLVNSNKLKETELSLFNRKAQKLKELF